VPAGYVHPTLNLDNPEDGVDPIRVVAGKKQKLDVNVALSNSFGFGGD
jgi:3-oxoacyl-[acyl-carrier-protein] synthase II